MATVFTDTYINARITAITAQIEAIETAITTLSSENVKSYSLNTGQTTQTVTKRDINRLTEEIGILIGRLQFWDDWLNNTGTFISRSFS